MSIFSTSILSIAFLLLSFQSCESAVKFYVKNLCKCEQLLYQEECDQYSHCQFYNSKCLAKACNEMENIISCWRNNNKCAWTQNRCEDFISCSVQGKNLNDCYLVSEKCQYDFKAEKCVDKDSIQQKSCSQLSQQDCFVGKDGICQYQKDSCSKMTSCESVDYDSFSCAFADPACHQNYVTQKCESQMGCQYRPANQCIIAPADINMGSFYICSEDINQVCQDLDISIQTVDTCFYDTFGYYHWTGSECEICNFSHVLLLMTILSIIVF